MGFGRATGDSAGVERSLDDGKSTLWATHFAEDARVVSAAAHQAVFAVATTQDSCIMVMDYRADAWLNKVVVR